MNKKELCRDVALYLRDNDIRKPVSLKKTVFHIQDSDGQEAEFEVKNRDKNVIYTALDVSNIIDALTCVIEESIGRGETVHMHGFGKFEVHRRAARKTKNIGTDDWVDVEARYVPKFVCGKDLKLAARIYELSIDSVGVDDDAT